jgi:hypothetical protein
MEVVNVFVTQCIIFSAIFDGYKVHASFKNLLFICQYNLRVNVIEGCDVIHALGILPLSLTLLKQQWDTDAHR